MNPQICQFVMSVNKARVISYRILIPQSISKNPLKLIFFMFGASTRICWMEEILRDLY
jgi:hypothetical protein